MTHASNGKGPIEVRPSSTTEWGIRIERKTGREEIGFGSKDDALSALADWRADLPGCHITLIVRGVTRWPWAIGREGIK